MLLSHGTMAPIPPRKRPARAHVPGKSSPATIIVLILVLLAAGAGAYFWEQYRDEQLRREAQVVTLDAEGKQFLETRRWEDARKIYDHIEGLIPNSQLAREGKRRVEAGLEEEEQQYLGYWSGEAEAALEAGRWEAAESAAGKVLEKRPANAEMTKLLADVVAGRKAEIRKARIGEVQAAIAKREWAKAREIAGALSTAEPADAELKELVASVGKAEADFQAKLAKAKALYTQAKALDTGSYSEEAMAFLREARALLTDDPEINDLYQKMSAYAKTLRVPDEYKTVAAALAVANPRDRIVVAAGTWDEPLLITKEVVLEGAGAEQTIFEADATKSPVLTVPEGVRNVQFVGIGFRHKGFAMGAERWSGGLVRGAVAIFSNCRFSQASGHGLAVIEGGRAECTGCTFSDNGWDGVSCYGVHSSLVLKDCLAERNSEHGIDVWDGATSILLSTKSNLNNLNGVLIASKGIKAVVEKCHFEGNREYGAVISDMRQGLVSENTSIGNQLGGYAILEGAAGALIERNVATRNEGPGILVDQGIDPGTLRNNQLSGNKGGEIVVTQPEQPEATEPPKAIPVQ